MQTETNAVFSKVLTSQGAAKKRPEETAVLYGQFSKHMLVFEA